MSGSPREPGIRRFYIMPKIYGLESFSEKKEHIYDDFKNQGYNYSENGIIHRVVSPELLANSLNDSILRSIELMFENLINAVRKIKLHYAITFPKNSKLIN